MLIFYIKNCLKQVWFYKKNNILCLVENVKGKLKNKTYVFKNYLLSLVFYILT
jgi:hypothetical protein